jgi:hypothetical protein
VGLWDLRYCSTDFVEKRWKNKLIHTYVESSIEHLRVHLPMRAQKPYLCWQLCLVRCCCSRDCHYGAKNASVSSLILLDVQCEAEERSRYYPPQTPREDRKLDLLNPKLM